MTTFILLLTFSASGISSQQIPGWSSQAACESAGHAIAKKLDIGLVKGSIVNFVCLKVE